MSKKARDAAIDRVGREFYGELWIGSLKTPEWKLGKKHNQEGIPKTLQANSLQAAKIANACFRSWASDIQNGHVFDWLKAQKINLSPGSFDAPGFDAWFQKKFKHVPLGPTAARRNAVMKRLKSGELPGRGGAIVWKRFCDAVRADCKHPWDDKTIKRDVKELRTQI